jgi:NADH:ubiquinone oxidoreductase subunit B-like Fe-S oxidoreductase
MREALERTHDAMPGPKWIVAVGDCAKDGGIFSKSYAVMGGVASVLPVDLYIPGCPPRPLDMLTGLLRLLRQPGVGDVHGRSL